MTISITYMWLIAGVVFFIAEAIGVSGIGLLFAGFGAVATGIAISLGLIGEDAHILQFIIFFATSAASAIILWKPIQKLRIPKPGKAYHNIIGETAFVGSQGLTKQKGGEVTWSGTIMKAQLAKQANVAQLEAGAPVVVVDISGATLIVEPKE